MARSPHQLQQIRNACRAREAAIKKLIENHRDEFTAIHEVEAKKRGVIPYSVRRRRKIAELRDQIKKLEGI